MRKVNMHEPKTHLSKLVTAAAAGEPFVIACGQAAGQGRAGGRRGRGPAKRRLGLLAGKFQVPDDFDTMFQHEIEEMFYGNPDKFQ